MTDKEALFRGILENPDDDTLRLIYADALEEAGDARRAAFVRAQVELARLPEYDPVRVRAEHHERGKLFDPRWVMDLPDLPEGLQWARESFRRGFPAAIKATDATAFVRAADDLFARFPIDALDLSVARLGEAGEFARCPWVSRLVRLTISQGLSGQAATRLLNAPHYDHLRELEIGAGLTTNQTATAVVRSRPFRQLTALSCRDDRGGGRALVTELTRLADPPRLKALDLSGNRLAADELGRLLAAPALSGLENLDLGDNNLGPNGTRVLAAARLPHLRSLHLIRTRPGVDGVRALAAAGFLPHLRSLSLAGNNLPPAAAWVLAESPAVADLRVLDLRDNALGDAGAAALAGCPHLRNLVHLDLTTNQIEDDGADALADSPHLGGLIALDLYGNVITPAATARLERRFGDRVFV